ncbi:MAG: oxygen-insensitive NAD(P)H nitroreductase [Spirochaetae bacterium HGW-Spirochaetae-5]|nr:MAG: oxygen-insensitive NAD(P)H nitroreductase [Spirochaetae bacterium HGW-Spirochaetae-5]
MKLSELVKERYTTKAFDPEFTLTEEQIEEIKTLLQYSPSSTNSQPWHFIITGTEEGKERIAKASAGRYEVNVQKIRDASYVIVLCSRSYIDDSYLQSLLANEEHDGRFADSDAKNMQNKTRLFYTNMHRFELKDIQHWTEKQVYIVLGNLLMGSAILGIDACPMEGFDPAVLNQELNLREKGYTSSIIVALGRHSEGDYNRKLPKSRWPQESVITELK